MGVRGGCREPRFGPLLACQLADSCSLAGLLQPGPPLDLNTMADLFLQRNMVREATAFLLDVLQDNDPKVR